MTHSAPRPPERSARTRGRVLVAAATRTGRCTTTALDDTIRTSADPALGRGGGNQDSYRSGCAATTGQSVPDGTPQSGAG